MQSHLNRRVFQCAVAALLAACAAGRAAAQDDPTAPAPSMLVVLGAEGAPEYGQLFAEWGESWRAAAEKAAADLKMIGAEEPGEKSDREMLQESIESFAAESPAPLWLVLIGHGTFDRQTARFNLRGPDVSAEDLASWLAPLKRPLVVINCSSASAPFLNKLSGKNRVIVTATRSGDELNFAHFGKYMSAAIDDISADLDKDGQVSLLEAYLTACRRVAEFYDEQARLATEHALLDDNGDGLGTPAAWFRGVRATQRAKEGAALDGTRAHQFHLIASDREQKLPLELRERRDEIEVQLAALRLDRERLGDDEYFARLEPLMLELARIYALAR